MIKKTTLFILLGAIILGVAVYYFDWRHSQKENEKPAADTTKPAYSIQAGDVVSLILLHPAAANEPALYFEKRNNAWQIVQPIETQADQPSLQGVVADLASARVSLTEPGTPDRLKVYGLDPPAVSLQFQLQNGSKHTLLLGNKDFTGVSVYSIVDGAKEVALLPESLLISSNKSLQDLRDHNVLPIVSGEVASFELKNGTGQLEATKEKAGWKFTKPNGTLADESSVDALLSAISNAKMTAIVSETPENLGKYGLANPATSFTATDGKGKAATLVVGKKEADEYFARDTSRPMIFRINDDLYKKLAENYDDLRDKKLVHFDSAAINHAEIHNASGTILCTRKSESEWTIEAPEPQKGKSADISRIFLSIEQAHAEQVFDHPVSSIAAKLAKPAIQITLTGKDSKRLNVEISNESDGFVYARTSNGPAIYKLTKQTFDDLNFKPADIVF